MSTNQSTLYEYQVGGSLPTDAPSYVKRQADHGLYTGLSAGEFCYILNSRQMGKSSLRVQTMQRLRADGVTCAVVDISEIGSRNITPEQWYAGIAYTLESNLGYSKTTDLRTWWREHNLLSPVQQLGSYLEEVVLVENPSQIVIFIDEIDSVLSLNFSVDDFFALIRTCYNKRVDHSDYNRLTFALLGVASPSDLVQDKRRTPFNIGKAISLSGFQFHEAQPLLVGLQRNAEDPQALLKVILDWTGGQPFLTQKLCKLIQSSDYVIPIGDETAWVEQLVQAQIIDNWESQDEPPHLKTIRDRLLQDEQRAYRLLSCYEKVLLEGLPVDGSSEHIELRLSGLVVEHQGKLKVYNRIYAAIFNNDWLAQTLADQRPYADALSAWVASNYSDTLHLLYGQDLKLAQAWAADRSLSDRDYQFLAASQTLDKQIAVDAEKEANRILVEAQMRARRIIQVGFAVLTVTVGMAIAIVVFAERANHKLAATTRELKRAEQRLWATTQQMQSAKVESEQAIQQQQQTNQHLAATKSELGRLQQLLTGARQQTKSAEMKAENAEQIRKQSQTQISITQANLKLLTTNLQLKSLELKASSILQQFQNNQIGGMDALVSAIRSVQELKLLTKQTSAQGYPITGPLLALQMILSDLHERRQFNPGQGWIFEVKFSPDGKSIATAGEDGTSKLWNLAGNQLAQFKGHQGRVLSISFSSNGKLILTGGEDGTARVWNLAGNQIHQLQGHQGRVLSASFNPDGKLIATTDEGGMIKLWNLDGKELAAMNGHQGWIFSIAFHPQGQFFATAGLDGTTRLWSLTGKPLAQLNGHRDRVLSLCFSPDGHLLATAGADDMIQIWDLSNPQVISSKNQWKSHQGRVLSMSFSPNGQQLASSGADRTIRLWDLSGQQLTALKGHRGPVNSLNFSPDGKSMVTAGDDGSVRFWDVLNQPSQLRQFGGSSVPVEGVNLSPEKNLIAISRGNGSIQLWNMNGQQVSQYQNSNLDLRSISFTPNGQSIVFAGDTGRVGLWNWSTNRFVQWDAHQGRILGITLSPDGQFIALTGAQGSSGSAGLWNLSGKQLARLQGNYRWLVTTSFSPDGKQIAAAGEDGTVWLWDLFGKQVASFKGHQGWILNLSFSSNGKWLATAGEDGTARLWDLSGRQLALLKGHSGSIYSVAFSSNGKWLATAGEDGTARLWDLSGRQLAQFESNQQLKKVSFSTDEKYLITVSKNGIVQQWRLEKLDDLLIRGSSWIKSYFREPSWH